MYPMIDQELIRQAEVAARRSGARARRRRESADASRPEGLGSRVGILIRDSGPEDAPALMQLADLDSHTPPAGRVIVAEAAGKIRAAIGVDDGTLIADPFVATRPLEDLLELRMTQIREAARRERGRDRGRSGRPFGGLHLRPRRAL
jgi:ribosomal protein L19E